jgi:hypothetical protein
MIYDKIVDKINKNPFKLYVGFFKPMKLGKLGDRQRISLGLTPDIPGLAEDIHINNFISLVDSQFNDSISKFILKDILNNSEKEYLDFSTPLPKTRLVGSPITIKKLNSSDITRMIVSEVDRFGCNNLVTNTRLGSNLQDSSDFIVSNSLQSGVMISKVGSLDRKVDVYIDPIMKWEDNYIFLFDDIYVDISNFSAQIINDTTLFPRLEVSYDLSFEIFNPKVLYVFEDEYMDNYTAYKQINRDRKINKILGE